MAKLLGFEGDHAHVLFDQARTRVGGQWTKTPYERLMSREDLVSTRNDIMKGMELQAGVIGQGLAGREFPLAAANLGSKLESLAFYNDAIDRLDEHTAGMTPSSGFKPGAPKADWQPA